MVNGWVQESTPFEAIMNIVPPEEVYEDRAMDVYAQMEVENCTARSSSSSQDYFALPPSVHEQAPYLSTTTQVGSCTQGSPIGNIVMMDHQLLVQLFTTAKLSTTKKHYPIPII
jgi:hypothetical protein